MMERELGEGYSFTKNKCFVCGSLSHLIKDCDYYEKKMAREAEVKKQRVFNTGNGVAKPVWTNANRVNHSNKFVPRSVQLNTGRTNINSVRPNINTGRTNVNPVRPRVNTGSSNVNSVRSRKPVPTKTSNSFSPKRPQVNQFNQRGHFSKSYSSVRRPFAKTTAQMSHFHADRDNWDLFLRRSAGIKIENSNPNSNCDSGPTFIRTVNAKGSSTEEHVKRGYRGHQDHCLHCYAARCYYKPNAGQEHPDVAQSQPSSSTIPVPSTSLPPVQSPPPITTPIPASTPTPIPETDPEPMEHTFEEPSPAHQHFSPRTNQRPRTEVCG
ncbi:hypothetical protein Tco_0629207 [Tanacetum coccineum]|uniref:CCHC-type domain-containing protein n=1 Tax=Tanacetum coccineum TaxID=301880 RepID=A0ABQ4WSP9_9ASTR